MHFFNETFLAKLLFNILGLSILLSFVAIYFLLKNAIRRRTYSKLIPSRKTRFIDIFGDFSIFPQHKFFYESTGTTLTSVLLQYLTGFSFLFKKEILWLGWISYFPFIGLNKPEAIEEVLKGTNVLKKAWFYNWFHCWFGTGLVTSDGEKWKSRRKLLTQAFHFDVLKDFLPLINEKSMVLVKQLKEEISKDYTSILPQMALCSLDIICQTSLGVDINCQEDKNSEFVKAVNNVTEAIPLRITSLLSWFDFTYFLTHGRRIKKDLKFLHDFTVSLIREKKKKMLEETGEDHSTGKRKALMDLLLQHHIETKELSEDDIREEVTTFVAAGHDTVAIGLSWVLYFIGIYKEVQDKVYEEIEKVFGEDKKKEINIDDLRDMKYLDCVIKESLRICPPVPLIGRTAEKNMKIFGYPVQNGTSLVVMPYMVHRNEEIYPNPEKFDPSRFTPQNSAKRHPYAYISFSAGARNCIGQRLALFELKIVMANILRNFTLESLDHRDKIVSSYEVTLKPKELRVKIRSR